MAGRAVGGAAGAGCGAFSLVGILLGVGLVVWLGSQVGSTSTGSGDGTTATVPSLPDGYGPVDPALSVEATPKGDLRDVGTVLVVGTGFEPGPVEITTCLAQGSRGAGGLAGCDPASTIVAEADPDGRVAADHRVTRIIDVLATPYDCAAHAEACVVVVHPPGAPDQGAAAAIAFPADLSVVDARRPPGG